MSLRKAGTTDVQKGSQEPWGVIRPPFENHCPREAWAKDRADIPLPYARRTRQLLKILKCSCSIWYITTGNGPSVQLHCPFHSGASLKTSHDPAKMRCWLAQQEFPRILLQHFDSDWPVAYAILEVKCFKVTPSSEMVSLCHLRDSQNITLAMHLILSNIIFSVLTSGNMLPKLILLVFPQRTGLESGMHKTRPKI